MSRGTARSSRSCARPGFNPRRSIPPAATRCCPSRSSTQVESIQPAGIGRTARRCPRPSRVAPGGGRRGRPATCDALCSRVRARRSTSRTPTRWRPSPSAGGGRGGRPRRAPRGAPACCCCAPATARTRQSPALPHHGPPRRLPAHAAPASPRPCSQALGRRAAVGPAPRRPVRPEPPRGIEPGAHQEVRRLGAATGSERTDEQTLIARFWSAPIQDYWNGIAEGRAGDRPSR